MDDIVSEKAGEARGKKGKSKVLRVGRMEGGGLKLAVVKAQSNAESVLGEVLQ